jgi:hypothetical protein
MSNVLKKYSLCVRLFQRSVKKKKEWSALLHGWNNWMTWHVKNDTREIGSYGFSKDLGTV